MKRSILSGSRGIGCLTTVGLGHTIRTNQGGAQLHPVTGSSVPGVGLGLPQEGPGAVVGGHIPVHIRVVGHTRNHKKKIHRPGYNSQCVHLYVKKRIQFTLVSGVRVTFCPYYTTVLFPKDTRSITRYVDV